MFQASLGCDTTDLVSVHVDEQHCGHSHDDADGVRHTAGDQGVPGVRWDEVVLVYFIVMQK